MAPNKLFFASRKPFLVRTVTSPRKTWGPAPLGSRCFGIGAGLQPNQSEIHHFPDRGLEPGEKEIQSPVMTDHVGQACAPMQKSPRPQPAARNSGNGPAVSRTALRSGPNSERELREQNSAGSGNSQDGFRRRERSKTPGRGLNPTMKMIVRSGSRGRPMRCFHVNGSDSERLRLRPRAWKRAARERSPGQ